MALEEGSQRFYTAVGERLGGREERTLFETLAGAEAAHAGKLAAACREHIPEAACEIGSGNHEPVGLMEGAVKIDEALDWVESEGRTPFEILELAMQVEANSLDLYLKITALPEFAPIRAVLEELTADEKKHLERMAQVLEKNTG